MDVPGLKAKAVSKAGRGVRSLFSKAPKSAAVLDRAARLLRRKVPGRVAVAADSITLDLHPGEAAVKLVATSDGELAVTASAVVLGPGYLQYVVDLLDGILEEIDFVWQPDGDSFVGTRGLAALQREFTTWLQHELAEIVAGRRSRQLAMPQHPRYEIEAGVLTSMGPRSSAWCDATLADGSAGQDLWPLWALATPATLARARGLWLLWMEVPWRTPMGAVEGDLMAQAHRELSQAYRLDAELELPWAEWGELVDYLDVDDDVTQEVRTRGAHATPTIGYRRHPGRFALAAGWSVRLTANFADSWQDDGASMMATDGDRSVRCSCAESEGDPASVILAKIPMHGEVLARFDEGGYQGRIEARDDEANSLRILTAIMATAGSAAVITTVLLPGDEAWAIETWRTLRCDEADGRTNS
jgi:hypothetical protein